MDGLMGRLVNVEERGADEDNGMKSCRIAGEKRVYRRRRMRKKRGVMEQTGVQGSEEVSGILMGFRFTCRSPFSPKTHCHSD